ncbi:MAG: hypothetical protein KA247_01215, partial [Bacteroidetes bacterium]|nr:hypothetical protein [Bacteroidota bacterium]
MYCNKKHRVSHGLIHGLTRFKIDHVLHGIARIPSTMICPDDEFFGFGYTGQQYPPMIPPPKML